MPLLDCMGPLPLSEQGNRYILTCQVQLSKYLVAIALPNQKAVTIARAVVDNVITVFGSPGSILRLRSEFHWRNNAAIIQTFKNCKD
jgi:hypothetical protein